MVEINIIAYIVPIVIILFVIAFIGMGIKIVPQSREYIVERFGKYKETLKPGFNLIIPFVDRVASRVSMKETILNVRRQDVISRDNASVEVDGVAFFQVLDSTKVTYVVNNLELALQNLIMTNIRTVMGSIDLDEMLSNRDHMNAKLLSVLDDATDPWGVKIVRVEIKDINPPADLLDSMAKQMKAEREKRAAILTAEGFRQAAILKAEGDKQSSILSAEGERQSQILEAEAEKQKQILQAEGFKEAQYREAEARERIAEAEAVATQRVSKAIIEGDVKSIQYFVAQEYIKALSNIASADNSKTIMMPLEAANVISSVGGISDLLKNINIK